MSFKHRSYEAELLDAEDIPTAQLYRNLLELNTINTLLGGHNITLAGLKAFKLKQNKPYRILDIGCGGGDNLRVLAIWARKHNLTLESVGVDLKQDCINYAKIQCKDFPEISFITSDYRNLQGEDLNFDIIFSALCCHHFADHDLASLLAFKQANARLGFFINDLHRYSLAYFSIKWLTAIFSKSHLVKNDAPLSVKRGFRKQDWNHFLKPFSNAKVSWKWAFRWLVVVKNNEQS
jgi:2-polyprenyl-3-methyl-5-hydroxy-6-metoxy-1,4-benzoquinol methylase